MYVMFLVLGFGLASAVVLPRCVSWYHAALVRYEADCLVSNLRLLQQMSRTTGLYPLEDVSDDAVMMEKPELEFNDKFHEYHISRLTKNADGVRQRQQLVLHRYPPEITISAWTKGKLYFGRNGGTLTNTTIEVYYEGERQRRKDVIVDIVGRIRVEEGHEK